MYKKNITINTIVYKDEEYRYLLRDFMHRISLSYNNNDYTEHTLQLILYFMTNISEEYENYKQLSNKPIYEFEYLSTFEFFNNKFKCKPNRRLNYPHYNDLCPNTFIKNCQIIITNTEIGEFKNIIQSILDYFYLYFRYLLKLDHVFDTRNEYNQYIQICKQYDIPDPPETIFIKEEYPEYLNYQEKKNKFYNKKYIKSFNNIEPLWPWNKNEGRHL